MRSLPRLRSARPGAVATGTALLILLAPGSALALAEFEAFGLSVLEVIGMPTGLEADGSNAFAATSTLVTPGLGPLSEASANASATDFGVPSFDGTDNLPSLSELDTQLMEDFPEVEFDLDFADSVGFTQAFVRGVADNPDWVDAAALGEIDLTLTNTTDADIEVEIITTSIAMSFTEVDVPLLETAVGGAQATVAAGDGLPQSSAQTLSSVPPGFDALSLAVAIGTDTILVPAFGSVDWSLSASVEGEAHSPIPEPSAALLFAAGAIAVSRRPREGRS